MTARHAALAAACECDIDHNCGRHHDQEAQEEELYRREFAGAAGLTYPREERP